MARPCKIPEDPEVLDNILENMALGFSCRLIGEAIGESEKTIQGWKARPDFKQKLAVKKLQLLGVPLRATADRFPKDFIERHPETRDDFAPPTQKQAVVSTSEVILRVEFVKPGDKKDVPCQD